MNIEYFDWQIQHKKKVNLSDPKIVDFEDYNKQLRKNKIEHFHVISTQTLDGGIFRTTFLKNID